MNSLEIMLFLTKILQTFLEKKLAPVGNCEYYPIFLFRSNPRNSDLCLKIKSNRNQGVQLTDAQERRHLRE